MGSEILKVGAIVALLVVCPCFGPAEGKVFERCELAQLLQRRHGLPLADVAMWVCIAQHTSGFNTATYGGGSGPSGGSHGIFQISDVYWCSSKGQGLGCNLNCARLRDDDLSDDVACARQIHAQHQRIAGDGYTAWQAYQQFCQHGAQSYIAGCFANAAPTAAAAAGRPYGGNSIAASYAPKQQRGKIYNRCELAQELYYKHHMQMDQIPTWVCIAQHESHFDTSAVGRLNADGSADHGLFQISDLFWCSHDRWQGGKACGLPCSKLLDTDISDDVRCVKRIFNEHTQISGDGFTAWTVYSRDCRNQRYEHVAACFAKPPVQSSRPQAHPNAIAAPNPYYKQQPGYTSANPFLRPTSTKYAGHPNAIGTAAPKPSYTYASNSNSQQPNSFLQHRKPILSATPQTQHYVPQKGKVYKRCELAQEMYFKHKFPMQDIATWACIAEHESRYDTAAVGRLNADGSADHGLFQISDLYWCTHDRHGGKGCSIPCEKLLDADITDDVKCIRTIHEEHTRISGDGFTAWTVYNPHCRQLGKERIRDCFEEHVWQQEQPLVGSNELVRVEPYRPSQAAAKGKIYKRCELAQELYFKHKMPMQEIPTWVCIAKYESSYNTAAVGRLNMDGSADHGLFQISDLYWCTHDRHGGKGCSLSCERLLDSDISDDIRCIRTIHEEHSRISGDGFNAWTVYQPHCRAQSMAEISDCFDEIVFQQQIPTVPQNSLARPPGSNSANVGTGKIYKRCELAQELYHKHKMPMAQIPTWVCIAKHESSYNTAAVGRQNADGSADHGLFQISDLYWCAHNELGGKACNIPCSKLLDNDISDDVHCIKIIYDEHTRISGDGFTAWTVYNPHCRNQQVAKVNDCFTGNEIEQTLMAPPTVSHRQPVHKPPTTTRKPQQKFIENHPYGANPFLIQFPVSNVIQKQQIAKQPQRPTTPKPTKVPPTPVIANHPYGVNVFLNQVLPINAAVATTVVGQKQLPQKPTFISQAQAGQGNKAAYNANPFLNNFGTGNKKPFSEPSKTATHTVSKAEYHVNPFLSQISKQPPPKNQPQSQQQMQQGSSKPTLIVPARPYVSSDSFRQTIAPSKTVSAPIQATTTTTVKPTTYWWQSTTTSTTLRPSTTTTKKSIQRITFGFVSKPTTTAKPQATRWQSTTAAGRTTKATTKQPTTIWKWQQPKTTATTTTTKRPTTTTKNSKITPTTSATTRKSTTTRKPTTTTGKTATPNRTSTTTTTKPTTNNNSTTNTRKSATTTRKPTTTNRKPTTNTRKPTTTTRKPTTTTRKPTTTTRKPTTTTRKLTTTTRKPTTTTRKPTTTTIKTTTITRKPTTTTTKKPATTTRKPATTWNWSTTTTRAPDTTTKQTTKVTTTTTFAPKTTKAPNWNWFGNRTTTPKQTTTQTTKTNWQYFINNVAEITTTTLPRQQATKTTKSTRPTLTTSKPIITTLRPVTAPTVTTPRIDPFDHPFFAKYKAQFENNAVFRSPITTTMKATPKTNNSRYAEKPNNFGFGEKNLTLSVSHGIRLEQPTKTTTTKRPTAKTIPTTTTPTTKSTYLYYFKLNNN